MGIPFYFVSLIKSHRGIVSSVNRLAPKEVDVLAVDFNCLIHKYLHEENPIQSVVDAFDFILNNVCRTKKLIIALDGLVPYAKIVQQRYRRMRTYDTVETTDNMVTFDRHQISPGTPYMKELENALAAKYPYAVISRTSEPGEGEHKLMLELDKISSNERQTICIYGLDADLILICLTNKELSKNGGMTLLRESGEFNDPSLKHADFATLNIWSLAKEIPIQVHQYIALSILCFGNDFMPNLGMFSLREDGYDRALHLYKEAKQPDLYTPQGRLKFLKLAASKEMDVFKERIPLRKRPEEKAILGKDTKLFSRKYGLHVLDGVQNMKPVVEAFWKTFHWTLDYFIESSPINWDWYYPYADAPLVSDIIKYTETTGIHESPLNYTINHQLQFIMPRTSLRRCKKLVKYVDELHSETRNPWMKRHEWEMKPRISLPWHPSVEITKISLLSN